MSGSRQIVSDEDSINLDDCYNLALDLVRKAGDLVKEGFEKLSKTVECKSGSWDLVTEYDAKVENLLINGITCSYPGHCFIAEETKADEVLTDAPTWIIDPVDGTNNFVHGIPFTAISVAFVLKKEIQIGIVYNPIMNEMYTARLGQGAFLNGKQIAVSNAKTLDESMYCHEISLARRDALRDKHMKRVYKITACSQGIRSFGCAALSLAYVARGSIDCYHLEDLYPWDVAAGALLIREAGGKVFKSDGGPYDIMDPQVVCAATDELSREVVEAIKVADEWNLRME
ncbi:Inositol monophosphatase ttx-7 [Pseudolycoriella hygida]|uniref:Inositol-1-monophosphatase n=1 Tax=Pseudolycoriella hygida TaxID=35572 RepID=A0A9Q0S6H6_9DIPT|nr:Inositol monophosphatase ttx-7 [Pseudolycoriella hygida]